MVSDVTMPKEFKNKKTDRSYFTNTKTMVDKTCILKSLLNIVQNMKGENFDIEEIQKDTSHHIISVLFSTKENLMSLLTSNRNVHVEKNRHDIVTEMDIWTDNLKENLEKAAKEKRLNDFLVSISASLSMKTWKDMCEQYAYQLISEKNPYKAVSYLLCTHKIYKAIEVLQTFNLYKEAYVLGRCKLESDDPALTTVLSNWATFSATTGNFEQAAYIYAKLGEFSDVVKYLARRKDATTLVTASEIALLCNDDDLSKSLAEQAMIVALTNSEYDLARSLITKYPYLKPQEIHLSTFEKLEKIIQKSVNLNMIQMWLDGKSKYSLLQTLEKYCGNCSSYYTELCQSGFYNTLENETMLWATVGHELALAVASTDKEQKLKHIVAAFHTITQFETMHRKNVEDQYSILMEFIIKLDSSFKDETSIYRETNYPVSISLRAYLCYALLSWFVYNLDKECADDDIQTYVDLIEHLLKDALNKQVVRCSLITNEINKLENKIASAKCKTQEEDKNDKEIESLMEELNTLKSQKTQMLHELVYVPNPVMVYGKANELCSKLTNETTKIKFSEVVSTLWTNATIVYLTDNIYKLN